MSKASYPKSRTKGLKPCKTTEEAKARGRKGGLAKKGSASLSAILRKLINDQYPGEVPGYKNVTFGTAINLKLIEQATKGNVKAIDIVYDRMEGKAKQELDANISDNRIHKIVVKFEGPEKNKETPSDK